MDTQCLTTPDCRVLSSDGLRVLGTYRHGPRWKSAVARDLSVDARLVRRWAANDRPVSNRCSRELAILICERRAKLLRIKRAAYEDDLHNERLEYQAIVEQIGSPEMRALLLALID